MNNKSFTLIELMIAILVVSILSSIIYIATGGARERADFAKVLMFATRVNSSLSENISGQWDFDEGSGSSVSDSSGNNNTGTITGATWVTTKANCVSGYCLSFDGDGDWVIVNETGFLDLGEQTIEYWFTPPSGTGSNWEFRHVNKVGPSTRNFYFYGARPGEVLVYQIRDSVDGYYLSTLKNNYIVGQWYHVVGSYKPSNGEWKIYINGQLDNYDTQFFVPGTDDTAVKFMNGKFNGKVDNIRIYNLAVSISQIQQNYFLGINSLYKNNGIATAEFNQRIVELKSNLVKQ